MLVYEGLCEWIKASKLMLGSNLSLQKYLKSYFTKIEFRGKFCSQTYFLEVTKHYFKLLVFSNIILDSLVGKYFVAHIL